MVTTPISQDSGGNVILTGGTGNDTFSFDSLVGGNDQITDFTVNSALSKFRLPISGGGLVAGALAAAQFVIGTAAATANELFVYDNSTGALYFDQDGSGSEFAQVEIVWLPAGLSLSASDFTLV